MVSSNTDAVKSAHAGVHPESELNALKEELLSVHRQLAAAKLDAQTAWDRYENANSSRITTEKQLEAANALVATLSTAKKAAGAYDGCDGPCLSCPSKLAND